jgi:hypothetical protein
MQMRELVLETSATRADAALARALPPPMSPSASKQPLSTRSVRSRHAEFVSRDSPAGACPIRPLLRWVGGKQNLTHRLASFLPPNVNQLFYREPFLGAGSLFFYLKPKRGVLSDLNEDLIETYRYVQSHSTQLSTALRRHERLDCVDHYYSVRLAYNAASRFSVMQAARFIYLNRTCFNGIYPS